MLINLECNGYDNECGVYGNGYWHHYGNSPYLNDDTTNYVTQDLPYLGRYDCGYSYQDLPSNFKYGLVNQVILHVKCKRYSSNFNMQFYLWNGSSWVQVNGNISPNTTWTIVNFDVSSILNSAEKINNAKFKMGLGDASATHSPALFWAHTWLEVTIVASPVPPVDVVVNEISIEEECIISIHYIKSHPSPDPDTFEIRLLPECGETINFFDTVEIKKRGVTEYYGFVEEITPEVGEDGLEYLITGRCWKLMTWKKWNERFQESREVGPEDSEGNIESGFFGAVKPEELVKFFMRCPISEHPKGKIRHKIGWGIASDYWDCCANVTADCFYPEWVALRYTGLSWRNRGDVDIIDEYVLDVKTFVSITQQWTTVGANPWLDAEDDNYIKHDASSSGNISEYYTFESFADIGESDPISLSTVYLCCTVWGELRDVSAVLLYLWDGSNWIYVGEAGSGPFYTKKTTCLNVTETLDTITKIKNARLKIVQKNKTWTAVDHAYLKVYGASPLNPANQRVDDWFIVDMAQSYDEVTAMLIECRNNPIMYARNYKIQYAIISNCCDAAEQEEYWSDFTPAVNVTENEARDILHSWEPEDDVRCIRIKLTMSDCNAWEISQIYVWQADLDKRYRLMDEG